MIVRMDYSSYREKIEWSNFWWDNAFERRADRILLIGDSTSREYRSTLARHMNRPVDFLGTSSAITDELFIKELEVFFSIKEYGYDVIQVQIGVHGIVSEGGQQLPNNYYQYYEATYEDMIKFLKSRCNTLILATITPVIKPIVLQNPILQKVYVHFHSSKKESIDEQFEEGIIVRNDIVRKMAKKYKLPLNDLYEYMKNEGRNFRHIDHVHYEKKAKEFIAARVATFCEDKR